MLVNSQGISNETVPRIKLTEVKLLEGLLKCSRLLRWLEPVRFRQNFQLLISCNIFLMKILNRYWLFGNAAKNKDYWSQVHDSSVGMILANEPSPAVGPAVVLPIVIEGVSVDAFVDTGSQSTIISQSLLHSIGRYLRGKGRPVPKLQPPSVKSYGKDGKAGGTLNFEADGISVPVIMFIQPDSHQPCLLGMNAIPGLGLTILNARGKPLSCLPGLQSNSATISLVQSRVFPAFAHTFVEAVTDKTLWKVIVFYLSRI